MLPDEQSCLNNDLDLSTADGIDEAYELATNHHGPFASQEVLDINDAIEEFRRGGQKTDLPRKRFSRYYECEQVSAKLSDGSYVSWPYWSGGSKYGEPREIDWMRDAFFVDCEEKQVMTTVYEFSVLDTSVSSTEQ